MIDIDDVLANTAKYWMTLFVEEYGNPEKLTIDDMYLKYHSVQNVPYWQNSEIDFWVNRFINSSQFQMRLPLIKDSNVLLTEISNLIPIRCYLTKRPERTRSGTEFWLKKFNFPEAELICRPNNVRPEEGNHWKAIEINKLSNEIIGVIDDDKRLIKILEQYKSIHFFLFGFPTYDIIDLRVYPCLDWQELMQKLLKVYNLC